MKTLACLTLIALTGCAAQPSRTDIAVARVQAIIDQNQTEMHLEQGLKLAARPASRAIDPNQPWPQNCGPEPEFLRTLHPITQTRIIHQMCYNQVIVPIEVARVQKAKVDSRSYAPYVRIQR